MSTEEQEELYKRIVEEVGKRVADEAQVSALHTFNTLTDIARKGDSEYTDALRALTASHMTFVCVLFRKGIIAFTDKQDNGRVRG